MGGQELSDGDFRLLYDAFDQVHAPRAVADVDVQDAGLAGQHSANADIGGDAGKLFKRRLRGAMVGHGNFTNTDDFINHHNILHQAAGQRMNGHLIRTAVNVGGNAFLLQAVGFCHKRGHIPADAVGTDASYDSGNAITGEVGKRCLRRSGRKAAFAAAAHDVLVAVDKARHQELAAAVDGFYGDIAGKFNVIVYGADFVCGDQNILCTQVLWCVNVCVFDQF